MITSWPGRQFTGVATYTEKLEAYQRTTGLKDAVITGVGKIGEFRVGLGVMDFSFLGGSMGSVVGEKLTRLIERGFDAVFLSVGVSRGRDLQTLGADLDGVGV